MLAGDIDSTWAAYEQFRGWPQPIVFIAGNHEFDGRELDSAWPALRERCAGLGITLLECESLVVAGADGRRIRFLGATRWSDFDLFGPTRRDSAMRAAGYFMRLMGATRGGRAYDAGAVRADALAARGWLESELGARRAAGMQRWSSLTSHHRSGAQIPRYGAQSGTASFCNADDDLLPRADLWLHGHLHCVHDYRVDHAEGQTRVVCNSRGHASKGEAAGHRPQLLIEV